MEATPSAFAPASKVSATTCLVVGMRVQSVPASLAGNAGVGGGVGFGVGVGVGFCVGVGFGVGVGRDEVLGGALPARDEVPPVDGVDDTGGLVGAEELEGVVGDGVCPCPAFEPPDPQPASNASATAAAREAED